MAKRTHPSRRALRAAPRKKSVARKKVAATKTARKKVTTKGKTGSRARPDGKTATKNVGKKKRATRATRTKAHLPAVPAVAPTRETEELEDLLVDAPTSFTVDVRQWRNGDGMEEVADPDPNSPSVLAAGDPDVRLDAASAVGDETPGGDNPTPDQDVVDLIGRSLGVEYADHEELEGGDEITRRDQHRWELDPLSSEDFRERQVAGAPRKGPGPSRPLAASSGPALPPTRGPLPRPRPR